MSALDRLHSRLVRSRLLQRFTATTRLLLSVGFVGPGLTKVLGHRFTVLPTTDPVGYFFDAFFQAQGFYMFVGAAQVAAGLLLIRPRTATLGATLYFPIVLNVTVITWSVGFGGTRWITLLMTLACTWLLVWDYDRFKALLPIRRAPGCGFDRREYARMALCSAGVGALGTALIIAMGFATAYHDAALVGAALVGGGAVFGLAVAWHLRGLPAPEQEAGTVGAPRRG